MTFDKPFDRITVEPDKMSGQPCIRGMRITVRRCLGILATYSDRARLFANYPDLEEGDLTQALAFASEFFHYDDAREPDEASPRSERSRPRSQSS